MIPEIKITTEFPDSLQDLIAATLKYYPVGFDIPNTQYSGYQNLLKIIEQKIDLLIDQKLPDECEALVKSVRESFGDYAIITEFERQFPNYCLTIKLLHKDLDEISIYYYLKLKISLLTNYFTIFYNELIHHKNIPAWPGRFVPLRTSVISSNIMLVDQEQKYLNILAAIVKECFPNYTFVNHRLLFNRRVRYGTPHGMEDNNLTIQYPLYNFLFDNDHTISPDTIIAF
ncbi:hypothetical protein FW774_16515 [Pedobacter sp. BS3]|uniref:hypothetical protein n=1 Tax=Pedobacter sp. BS3 TaxID=2567937 RepID=UPI0011EF4C59|nr:hypothetical protein [Pedobacter sp. BS3]TZF82287.1 hypothetical protein FW774_16515 [Pedobacter sp. BS3]